MPSFDSLLNGLAASLFAAAAGCVFLQWRLHRRCASLRQELMQVSGWVFQMAELQLMLYRKVAQSINEVEDKVLDLAVPGSDPSLPLERRYRVLTLSGRGLSAQDVAARLRMPVGEVELILNLRNFADAHGTESHDGGRARRKGQAGEMLA
jgi:hypothetical protein